MITTKKGMFFLIVIAALGFVPMLIWPEQANVLFWVFMGAVALGLIKLLYDYMLWYFSIYVVTNQRIRQVSQRGLFKKTVVDLGLDKIQTVSYNIPGLFGGMLGYGTLVIQTQVGDMVVSTVSKPEKIYNKLQDVIGENND
jgi:hypothetical protein